MAEKYSPLKYPKFDEYDAINVNKVRDTPCDYDGLMGVPITFLFKYCPGQFEIIGCDKDVPGNPHPGNSFKINGKETYTRIVIKNIGKSGCLISAAA